MDRAHVWRDFEEDRILYEDDDLIAVDKPVGMSSQAADPDRPDDVVTRLRAFLEGQGRPTYLGVHQRLDRDTSGVLVMTRRREANPSMAAQFEGRKVSKRYRACVTGWPKERTSAVLDDLLAPADGGAMRVVGRGARGAQRAVTRVKLLEHRDGRALLELSLETGRTHQARVQLAHAGAPIAGDRLYGGSAAPRLMLHAHALDFQHPSSGKPFHVSAPEPPELRAFLSAGEVGERVFDRDDALDAALRRAFDRRFALGRADRGDRATTAFRVVHEAGDALPKLAVDVYGDFLVAHLYEDGTTWTKEREARVLDRLHAMGADGVYVKRRPKQANILVDTRRDELAPRTAVRGTSAPDTMAVLEEGIPYLVSLGDGLATGIYLDQRGNRRRVREWARGKSVANLFAYTCAFSVAAAVGGASRTVSVDASQAALERGRANFEANRLPLDRARLVAEDAFAWIGRATAKKERYDLVILDPPSFSTTRQTTFTAAGDYGDLATQALALVSPGGKLLCCVNHRGLSRGKFRRTLRDAAAAAGREVAQLKDIPDPLDFPAPMGGQCTMKSVLLTLP